MVNRHLTSAGSPHRAAAQGDANPLMAGIGRMAEWVKEHRRPVAKDNPFIGQAGAFARNAMQLDVTVDLQTRAITGHDFHLFGPPFPANAPPSETVTIWLNLKV